MFKGQQLIWSTHIAVQMVNAQKRWVRSAQLEEARGWQDEDLTNALESPASVGG
jgi:hypothetical protein